MCGLETLTEASAGNQVVTYKKSDIVETLTATDFESWFTVGTAGFTATTGADWTGCKINSYALLDSDGGAAYTDAAKASFDGGTNTLTLVLATVQTHFVWL